MAKMPVIWRRLVVSSKLTERRGLIWLGTALNFVV